jgi:hypothetical protein
VSTDQGVELSGADEALTFARKSSRLLRSLYSVGAGCVSGAEPELATECSLTIGKEKEEP